MEPNNYYLVAKCKGENTKEKNKILEGLINNLKAKNYEYNYPFTWKFVDTRQYKAVARVISEKLGLRKFYWCLIQEINPPQFYTRSDEITYCINTCQNPSWENILIRVVEWLKSSKSLLKVTSVL